MKATELELDLQRRIGTVIQKRRMVLGLTQALVAKRANVGPKYFGEIERGEANVTLRVLARVAATLDWDPWMLFDMTQHPISQNVHTLALAELTAVTNRLGTLRAWFASLDQTQRFQGGPEEAGLWARVTLAVSMGASMGKTDGAAAGGALPRDELCPAMRALADARQGSPLEPRDDIRAHVSDCGICAEQVRHLLARDAGVRPTETRNQVVGTSQEAVP